MLVKTKKLKGVALDWAVAKALGEYLPIPVPNYSTDWALSGPIIEREDVTVTKFLDYYVLPTELQTTQTIQWGTRRSKKWNAYCSAVCLIQGEIISRFEAIGVTPLIAAMRCYVASKLGDEIDIPEELVNAPI